MSLINKEKMMEEIRAGFEAMDIIGKMPTVNAIQLDKVKQVREEIENWSTYDGIYIDRADVLKILDKRIEEVEG